MKKKRFFPRTANTVAHMVKIQLQLKFLKWWFSLYVADRKWTEKKVDSHFKTEGTKILFIYFYIRIKSNIKLMHMCVRLLKQGGAKTGSTIIIAYTEILFHHTVRSDIKCMVSIYVMLLPSFELLYSIYCWVSLLIIIVYSS